MRFLKLDLIDDHVAIACGAGVAMAGVDVPEARLRDVMIGYIVLAAGCRIPQVVGCCQEGARFGSYVSLNEIYAAYGVPHLSRTSLLTISPEQLVELQVTGRLYLEGASVYLFEDRR